MTMEQQHKQSSTTTRTVTGFGEGLTLDEKCEQLRGEFSGDDYVLLWLPLSGEYAVERSQAETFVADGFDSCDEQIPFALTDDGINARMIDVDPDCDNDVMDELPSGLSELGYGVTE